MGNVGFLRCRLLLALLVLLMLTASCEVASAQGGDLEVEWQHPWGGSSYEEMPCIALDNAGNIIAADQEYYSTWGIAYTVSPYLLKFDPEASIDDSY